MCVPTDCDHYNNTRRRHRATYLAPARHRNDLTEALLPPLPLETGVPLLFEEQETAQDNSSDTALLPGATNNNESTTTNTVHRCCSCLEESSYCGCCIRSCSRAILDLGLLGVVLVMGVFLYDMEVNVQAAEEQTRSTPLPSRRASSLSPPRPPRANRMLQRWGSGRVILRNQVPPASVMATSLQPRSEVHESIL